MDKFKYTFPHIRFTLPMNHLQENRGLYYIGGESDHRLITGNLYYIENFMYSENPEDKRKMVWACNVAPLKKDRFYLSKRVIVDLKNFGTIADLRNKKIDIIYGK